MKLFAILVLICSVLFLNSCKREEVLIEKQETTIAETVNPSISEHEMSFFSRVLIDGEERGCLFYGDGSQYDWNVDYRITEGHQTDDKVFYPLEKKWEVNFKYAHFEEGHIMDLHDSWRRKIEWTETGELYRYDPNQKLAFLYDSEEDQNPETIMDFNLAVGDTWDLNTGEGFSLEVVSVYIVYRRKVVIFVYLSF